MSTIVGMAPAEAPVEEPKAKKASGKKGAVIVAEPAAAAPVEEPKSDGDSA